MLFQHRNNGEAQERPIAARMSSSSPKNIQTRTAPHAPVPFESSPYTRDTYGEVT